MKEKFNNKELAKNIGIGVLAVGFLLGSGIGVNAARNVAQAEQDALNALCGEDYQACFVTSDLSTNTGVREFCDENPENCIPVEETVGAGGNIADSTKYYIRIPDVCK